MTHPLARLSLAALLAVPAGFAATPAHAEPSTRPAARADRADRAAARGGRPDQPGRPGDGKPGRPGGRGKGGGPGGNGDGGQAVERFQRAVDELGLSDEQKAKFLTRVEDAREELKLVRDDFADASQRERGQAIRTVLQDLRQDLTADLTPEQQATLQEMIDRRQAGGGGPGSGLRMVQAVRSLDLTAEQQPAVREAMMEARAKMQEARADPTAAPDPEVARQIFADARRKVVAVLTPEQREQFRAAMQPGRPGGADGERPRKGGDPSEKARGKGKPQA